MKKIFPIILINLLIGISDIFALQISEVTVNPQMININSQSARVSFYIDTDANIKLRLYDADNYIVKEIEKQCFTGMNYLEWDGKDKYGNAVPNDAYYFTIEAKDANGGIYIYDPTDSSGGEDIFVTVPIDFTNGYNVDYFLKKPAKVRIRANIYRTAVLNTIIDWGPRLAIDNTENWDGKDESGLIEVPKLDKFFMKISAYALPDNSIITAGNSQTYIECQKRIAQLGGFNNLTERLNSPEGIEASERASRIRANALSRPNVSINEHYMLSKSFNFTPDFTIELISGIIRMEDNLPVVKDEIAVKITLDDDSKNMLINQQYEVSFILDDVIISEEEEGYSPFTKFFDTKRFRNGEHFLIVNISGLNDYVGEKSIRFKVEN
ncbi:MAG: FlgD immunoglobulin-like domain containing protein [bacterium]